MIQQGRRDGRHLGGEGGGDTYVEYRTSRKHCGSAWLVSVTCNGGIASLANRGKGCLTLSMPSSSVRGSGGGL